MKIGSSFTPPTPAFDDKPGSVSRGTGSSAGVSRAGSDAVSLSPAAASIGSLDAAASDFDGAKVESIRQAIRDGRFSVNAEAIADKLIAEATALLGPRSH